MTGPLLRPMVTSAGLSRLRPRPAPRRLAQAIAVTSGKGGVGKSNLAVNLAVCLAKLGRNVCLLDADLGLANVDVLCNLTPRLTLEHVVSGRCHLAEVMLLAPGGFRLIPGACGVSRLADLNGGDRSVLLDQLFALERVADAVIIDTSAGLSANVLAFAAAAGRVVVVTTPEPTAMTDAYGMIKALSALTPRISLDLVVNMVSCRAEAQNVHQRMDRVSRTFLGRSLELAAAIPADPAVREAVHQRIPCTLYAPNSQASGAIRQLARRLAAIPEPPAAGGFVSRLAAWFSSRRDFAPIS